MVLTAVYVKAVAVAEWVAASEQVSVELAPA